MKQLKSILLILSIISLTISSYSQEIFTSTKSRKALQVYQQSDEYLMAKRYKEAELVLLNALKYDSNYIDALMRLSTLYYRTGKQYKEKSVLERVIRIQPKYPNAYFNYAFWNMRFQKTASYIPKKSCEKGFHKCIYNCEA